jgi:LEA14-like dessication related protein
MSIRFGRRMLGAITFSAAAMTAAGCAMLGRGSFKEPVVTLREVTVTGLGISGGNVDVVLSVYNPNGFALDAVKMTYKVDVDSIALGDGALDTRFVVPKNDSSIVRLPVRFTYAGLGAAGRGLMQSGALNYRVRGDFTVATPLGNFTRPYDQRGRYSTMGGR